MVLVLPVPCTVSKPEILTASDISMNHFNFSAMYHTHIHTQTLFSLLKKLKLATASSATWIIHPNFSPWRPGHTVLQFTWILATTLALCVFCLSVCLFSFLSFLFFSNFLVTYRQAGFESFSFLLIIYSFLERCHLQQPSIAYWQSE